MESWPVSIVPRSIDRTPDHGLQRGRRRNIERFAGQFPPVMYTRDRAFEKPEIDCQEKWPAKCKPSDQIILLHTASRETGHPRLSYPCFQINLFTVTAERMVCLQSFVDARIHIENINSQRSKWNGMEASENLSDISRFDRGSRYIRAIIKQKKRRLKMRKIQRYVYLHG